MRLPSPFRPGVRTLAALLALAAVSTSCRLISDLDDERREERPLALTSRIYDARGNLLTTLHAEEDRELIPVERIPRTVKDAVVAIEDQRFWNHRGVDLKAVLRAAYVNATTGEILEGGSTITQQYVKNRILGPEKTLGRKMKEAALAWQLEQELSKEDILGRYLNTVYFGQGAYGISRGAEAFFSRPAAKLMLPQAALLAGLIAGPERWDPIDRPDAALARRNAVLARMHELGMIKDTRYERAIRRPLGLRPKLDDERYPAAYFVGYVKDRILGSERFGETYTQRYNLLFKGGLRIYTTLDLRMQRAAEAAVRGVLSQPGDPYGGLTAIDPRNGHIKAMVGGRNYFARRKHDPYAKVNLATGGSTGRQAGSSFKPFALVAALEEGIPPAKSYPAPSSLLMDDPPCGSEQFPWDVENYEGSSYGGALSMEQATISSVNVVYAQIIRDVRPESVVEIARRMGIRSKLRPYCSAVLGSNEVNTLEMASAFGTLATGGHRVAPTSIIRIEDARGNVLFEPERKKRRALNPAIAWTATQILRKVILSGTGTAANIGRPAAGKTGTAQMWRDAWFAGYIPQLSAAVWVGFPQGQISMTPPRTRIRVTGGSFPAQIWRAFMTEATDGMPIRDFQKPAQDFITVPIDVVQGCLATEATPRERVRYVQFVPGSEPKEPCTYTEITGTVPSVVGMSARQAAAVLRNAGFGVETYRQETSTHPRGTVLDQEPDGGTSVPRGSPVLILVAS